MPSSSTLAQVLPYLLRLAVSDPQLYWRLGTALVMMVVSKSAGGSPGAADTCNRFLHCRAGVKTASVRLLHKVKPQHAVQSSQPVRHTGLAAPVFLKRAIDALGATPTQAAVHAAVIALLLSGACRVLNSLAKEAQGPLFTPVSQASSILPFCSFPDC